MTTPSSPFETTRLPDLPPTVRLAVAASSARVWLRRTWPGLALGLALGLLALITVLLLRPAAAAEGRALPIPVATATPALAVPAPASAAPVMGLRPDAFGVIIAYHAPAGAVAGEVRLAGEVAIVEQYQGWARFQLAGYPDLWAPIAELARAVPVDRIAAAPVLAPTAAPTAAPQVVYVTAPPAPLREPAPPAAAAIVEPAVAEAPGWHPPFASGYDPGRPPLVLLSSGN